jgi:glycosyltransferase involved in cell wall biosynthesis
MVSPIERIAMIQVLGLALYGPLAASTRYRLGQYVEGLEQHGIRMQIRHVLGDEYLSRRFAGLPVRPAALLRMGAERLRDLLRQGRFDAAMLYGELLPLVPGAVETALMRLPFIYDFDDAFYLKYRLSRFAPVRTLLGGKFDRVMQGAAHVTAGNQVLASYASRQNANTHLLPTVVDTKRYQPMPELRNAGVFTIGWIGSPSTAEYLAQLVEPLASLGLDGPVRFVVVGGKSPAIPNVEVVELPWSEDAEIRLINTFDIGVMPLPDTDWARGKCAFKLIQYMACGVPVVASPVGANKAVVRNDCGILAGTVQEWTEAFRKLRDAGHARRQAMGEAGREHVEKEYSLARTLPRLADVLLRTAGKS